MAERGVRVRRERRAAQSAVNPTAARVIPDVSRETRARVVYNGAWLVLGGHVGIRAALRRHALAREPDAPQRRKSSRSARTTARCTPCCTRSTPTRASTPPRSRTSRSARARAPLLREASPTIPKGRGSKCPPESARPTARACAPSSSPRRERGEEPRSRWAFATPPKKCCLGIGNQQE